MFERIYQHTASPLPLSNHVILENVIRSRPVTMRLIVKKLNSMLCFQNVVGLVTGGASGLGRATVERFIKQGAKVVMCDLPSSDGAQVAASLGENCAFVPGDVSLNNC